MHDFANPSNLECPMCWRTDRIRKEQFGSVEHMPMELYRKIVTEAGHGGVAAVKLCLLGEPLMHPDIREIVRFAKEQGIIDVMFNTNAVLLTEEMARGLLAAGIDGIFVSFDPVRYEKIRVGRASRRWWTT